MMGEYEESIVIDCVKADFECGMPMNDAHAIKRGFIENEDWDEETAEEATDFYLECVQMGPKGFYDEHYDLDWSRDFRNTYDESCDEYGEDYKNEIDGLESNLFESAIKFAKRV